MEKTDLPEIKRREFEGCYFFSHDDDIDNVICYHSGMEWKDSYLLFYGFDHGNKETGEEYENRADIVYFQLGRIFPKSGKFPYHEITVNELTFEQYDFFKKQIPE